MLDSNQYADILVDLSYQDHFSQEGVFAIRQSNQFSSFPPFLPHYNHYNDKTNIFDHSSPEKPQHQNQYNEREFPSSQNSHLSKPNFHQISINRHSTEQSESPSPQIQNEGRKAPRSGRPKERRQNSYKTKNMLQFFVKQLLNYLGERDQRRPDLVIKSKLDELKEKKMAPSIRTINVIFNQTAWETDLAECFEDKYLVRRIACSGLKNQLKKCYLTYIRVLEKGFHSKLLLKLNN